MNCKYLILSDGDGPDQAPGSVPVQSGSCRVVWLGWPELHVISADISETLQSALQSEQLGIFHRPGLAPSRPDKNISTQSTLRLHTLLSLHSTNCILYIYFLKIFQQIFQSSTLFMFSVLSWDLLRIAVAWSVSG